MKPHLAACLFALAIGCRRASAGAPPAVRSEVVLAAAGGLSFARLEVRSAAGARVNVYGGFDAPSVGGQAPRCGDAPCAKEAVVDAFGLATLRVPLTNDALVGASAERRTLSVEVTREGAQGRATHTITPAPALIPYGYGLSVAGRAGHIEIAGDGSVQARDLPAGAALQVGSLPAARVGADGGARVAMDPSQTLAATPLNRMTRALEDPNGSGLLWTPRLALEGAADGGGLRVTLRYPDGVSLAGDLALRPAQAEAMLAAKARRRGRRHPGAGPDGPRGAGGLAQPGGLRRRDGPRRARGAARRGGPRGGARAGGAAGGLRSLRGRGRRQRAGRGDRDPPGRGGVRA